MDIFGIGLPELLLIMVIALIVFGPGKLPEIGAAVGRAIGDFKRASRQLTGEFTDSIAEARSEVEQTVNQAKAELQDTGQAVQEAIDVTSAAPSAGAPAAKQAVPATPAEEEALSDSDKKWLELGTATDDGAQSG